METAVLEKVLIIHNFNIIRLAWMEKHMKSKIIKIIHPKLSAHLIKANRTKLEKSILRHHSKIQMCGKHPWLNRSEIALMQN